MTALLRLFWQICTLRGSAAHVPGAGWFASLVVLANLLLSFVLSLFYNPATPWQQSLTTIVTGQATIALLIWMALQLRGLPERYTTTLAAVFGCDLIITACFAAVLPVAGALGMQGALILGPLLIIWTVAVFGYILHQALNLPLMAGILFALGMLFVSLFIGQAVVAR